MSARGGMAEFNRWFYEGTGTRRRRKAIAKKIRLKILERDGHRCQHCGATEKLTLDHIIPCAKGGTNAQANLQVLCEPCNWKKDDSL